MSRKCDERNSLRAILEVLRPCGPWIGCITRALYREELQVRSDSIESMCRLPLRTPQGIRACLEGHSPTQRTADALRWERIAACAAIGSRASIAFRIASCSLRAAFHV